MKPTAPAYVGAPPEELVTLIDDTIEAAKTLARAAKKVSEDCAQTGTGRCLGLRADALNAINAMMRELDAWSPYL